jgi:phosphoenolpyruvate carboxykinase (GTP)
LWPGFGENSRVLKWVCERVDGTGEVVKTPMGFCPPPEAIDVSGLEVTEETMKILTTVDTTTNPEEWKKEIQDCKEYYAKFGNDVPAELQAELQAWVERLGV